MLQACGLVSLFTVKDNCNSSHETNPGNNYLENGGSKYDRSLGIMAILVACALTAGCSAVNASLLRSGCMGLHAQNVVLYTLGAASNLVLFWLRLTPSSHISFFSGYREHPLAIALLLSNAFVGILITFVYRFGNAVVKTLATNVSSAVLLLLPFLAPGALWGAAEAGSGAALRTVCGCGVVLVAAVIYLENPPLESSRISESAGLRPSK
mmetsp:Transcript_44452/g.100497  ORF Transcript_44452/g.100497 Transcript_44452/m.100497 type:complete len:210 (-) Transcript_44452:133-762(-)